MMSQESEEVTYTFSGYLGPEFQLRLMWQILVDPEFAEKIIPFVGVEYFDDPSMKKLFIIILQYFNEYTKPPNLQNQSIFLAIQKYKSHNDPVEEEVLTSIVTKIKLWNERVLNKDLQNDGDVIQKESFLFCKQQEYRKLSEFILEKTKKGEIKSKTILTDIEEKIRKINIIGDDEDYGIPVTENMERALRDEFRETIPTGIGFLDEITGGGLGKGESGIVLSPSGYGKSSMLTKIANSGVNEGKNVLQIIFEDTEDQIRRKHYAIWSKIPLSEFKGNKEIIIDRVNAQFNEHKKGQLIVKRFIEDETTIPQIKKWIERYQKKYGIIFDLLILDYLDCLESHKKTSDPNEAEKFIVKAFMAMGAELDIPCWSAVQSGRLGFSAEILEAGHIGGSIKRVQKTHLLISIAKTADQKDNDLANIKIIKARFAKDGQLIKDCIFNNDTMEIRATDNSWRTNLKKYDEKDLEKLDDNVLLMHSEISKYDEKFGVTDSIMSNVNFDNNKTGDYSDVDDFIKSLENGNANREQKDIINDLLSKNT